MMIDDRSYGADEALCEVLRGNWQAEQERVRRERVSLDKADYNAWLDSVNGAVEDDPGEPEKLACAPEPDVDLSEIFEPDESELCSEPDSEELEEIYAAEELERLQALADERVQDR